MPAMDWNYSLNKFTKMCTKCKLEYEGNDNEQQSIQIISRHFTPDKNNTSDGLYSRCRLCMKKPRTDCNPKEMLVNQEGKCAICLRPMKQPCLDHNHTTGKVRELLCVRCNVGLGYLEKDPSWLKGAFRFLKKHKG